MSTRTRPVLIAAALLTSLVTAPAAHAWEIGYRFGTFGSQFDLLPRNDFEKNTPDQQYYTFDYARGKMGFNVPMHTLVFVDESGALLGGMATGVNRAEARKDAIRSAARRGAQRGETITYSYREVGAAGGLQTRFALSWGSGTGVTFESPLTNGPQPLPAATVDLFQFDMRVPFPLYRHERVDLDFLMDLYLRNYTILLAPSTREGKLDERHIGMPFGLQARTYPLSNLRLRGVAGYDAVFGLISVLASSVAPPIPPTAMLGLGVDYTLGNGLELSGDAEVGAGQVGFNRAVGQSLFRVGASYRF